MFRIYNTATASVVPFEPSGPEVKFFTCGPTVYARAHLGHGKSYVVADMIKRMLLHEGYKVRHVINYTDISDETARRAAGEGIGELQVSKRCEKAFEVDMARLNVIPPALRPRVSEHIKEIIKIIEELVKDGKAYVTKRGVYLRISRDDYGPLMRHPLEELLASEEPKTAGGKESPLDFALWEPPPDCRLTWESPWGPGRPGWHPQDFAFLDKHLGLPIDIYSGGVDLIFPHHESERIMAMKARGKEASRYWIHNQHVVFEGEKLSKSKGVRVEIKELAGKYGGETVRFFLLQDHYKERTHYTEENMEKAARRFAVIREAWQKLEGSQRKESPVDLLPETAEISRRIVGHLQNDLRTDLAMGELDKLAVLTMNEMPHWTEEQKGSAVAAWGIASKLLGILEDHSKDLKINPKEDECFC